MHDDESPVRRGIRLGFTLSWALPLAVVLWAVILGLPTLMLASAIESRGGDPWWGLAAGLMVAGFSLYWFAVGMPLSARRKERAEQDRRDQATAALRRRRERERGTQHPPGWAELSDENYATALAWYQARLPADTPEHVRLTMPEDLYLAVLKEQQELMNAERPYWLRVRDESYRDRSAHTGGPA